MLATRCQFAELKNRLSNVKTLTGTHCFLFALRVLLPLVATSVEHIFIIYWYIYCVTLIVVVVAVFIFTALYAKPSMLHFLMPDSLVDLTESVLTHILDFWN